MLKNFIPVIYGFDQEDHSAGQRLSSKIWNFKGHVISHNPFKLLLKHHDRISPQTRHQIAVLAASGVLIFTACGINFSFGVYQEHYEVLNGPFREATPAQISLIGTLASCLMMMGAPLVNQVVKRYGAHLAVMVSGLLFALSGTFASLGRQLWHFQLTQGILQGCGACLAYIPAVTITPQLFSTRRGLAMGIVTSGTGMGGVVLAPLLRNLLSTIGFRPTLIFAGLSSAVVILAASTAFERSTENFGEKKIQNDTECDSHESLPSLEDDHYLFRSKPFFTHTMASTLQSAAYFTPLYFMSTFATSLGFSETSGANIIALCNFCNFLGKILIGYIADRQPKTEFLAASTAVSALVSLGLAGVAASSLQRDIQKALLLLYAILYGMSAGAYVALLPTALIENFGVQGFTKINSIVYMFRGIGSLIGTWSAGSFIKVQISTKTRNPADFVSTFLFVGVSLAAAAAFVLGSKNGRLVGSP